MSRKAIPPSVVRILLAKSGGYCQNPACNANLFLFFENGEITSVQELAHIIAQSADGPRGDSDLPLSERDSYENIILLCPTCHSIIDKNSNQYPTKILLKWKKEHEQKIDSIFRVATYQDRLEFIAAISKLLRLNRHIYQTYGPLSTSAANPLSDAAEMWQMKVLEVIIPHNRAIANLLTRNEHLLTEQEREVAAKFLIHQEGFEFNHLSGDKNTHVTLFPKEIYDLLGD